MPNGSCAPLTPPEVLAKLAVLSKRYGYSPPGSGGKRGIVPKIARELELPLEYTRKLLNGQRGQRRAAIEITVNSLTLVRGTGFPCRLCEEPTWLFVFPSRLCVSCQLLEYGKRGIITVLDREPVIPDDVP